MSDAPSKTDPRPLAGLKVLDFSTTIAGPHCSRLLADLGADVIKVEALEGDLMRSRPVVRSGASTIFGQLNAGKRSIVLDLKKPEAIAAVKKIATKVDIVLENYRPGVMKRLGIDYPVLAAINPRLVYCAISGYGQTGPGAGRPAYAPVIHASTGYDMAQISQQDGRQRPDNCAIFVADYASGAYAMAAIMAAVHQRHVTGKGQMVDVSMFETLIGMLPTEINRSQFDFEMPSRPMYGPIEAGDGYVMLATASERTFQDMASAANRRDWLTDPRFEKYADRRMNWGEMVEELEKWSKKLTVKEVVAALEKHGVPCSPYLTLTEALDDPQVEHRGSLCTIDDAGGTYKSPAPPFRFSGSAMQSGPHVPGLGENTREILRDMGISEAEALLAAGIAR
jgi:crotonobetainyl-CoA:carnitine CoA-transferase CaiB-like acyl-CoA transferase